MGDGLGFCLTGSLMALIIEFDQGNALDTRILLLWGKFSFKVGMTFNIDRR